MPLVNKRQAGDDELVSVNITIKGLISKFALTRIRALVAAEQATHHKVELIDGPAKPLSVSTGQERLMRLIREAGRPLSTTELHEQSGLMAGTIRPLLARTVDIGFVERGSEISGPRYWALTPAGEAYLAKKDAEKEG